ncbi:MAG: UDP-N-acetylglucosamine 1-carboxyvinyltransferase [Nitrospirae bacterium]|nr:UDP-N-acetylglucosamine 1-carboxyvinyltransferase [Nitrospirota bacterium]
MDRIKVEGGARLQGRVSISGAKNGALPSMAAALLAQGRFRLARVPSLMDVITMQKLLKRLGATCEYRTGEGVMEVEARQLTSVEAPYDLVRTMRASILVLGPLVARCGEAVVSLPGGCAIGSRPVDFHIEGLRRLGAAIELSDGYIRARTQGLKGARVVFPIPSVTGTENLLMAAVLAQGETVFENAACEPEVTDLARLLRAMGARIEGEGTTTIRVQGVSSLKAVDWEVVPDRIETGTFALAAAMTGGELVIERCRPEHVTALLDKVRAAGATVEEHEGSVRVLGNGRPRAVDVTTDPYPGFPTDLQAQFMAWMAVAEGSSIVAERVFQQRFIHVSELRRMGADISVSGSQAVVRGVPALQGAEVMATDLRASASLVLAGLIAKGATVVHRVYHLDRGYERMVDKLRAVGARIDRLK